MPCKKCGAKYSVEAILDHSKVCWPQQRWLLFTCPACNYDAHIEIGRSTVSIGGLDGAPGPCFFADATIKAPGLRARKQFGGMRLEFAGRSWNIRGR